MVPLPLRLIVEYDFGTFRSQIGVDRIQIEFEFRIHILALCIRVQYNLVLIVWRSWIYEGVQSLIEFLRFLIIIWFYLFSESPIELRHLIGRQMCAPYPWRTSAVAALRTLVD